MKTRTKERILFWAKQFDEPDEDHDFIVNLVVAIVGNVMLAAGVWWAVYTTYLS